MSAKFGATVNNSDAMKQSSRFPKIPAPPASRNFHRRSKFRGFIGTTFPQPNNSPLWEKIHISGNRTVPNTSMCARGLSVTRPAAFGVSSPQRYATHACAHSCTVKPMSNKKNANKCFAKREASMDNRQYPKEFQTLGVLGVIIGKYRILRKQKTPAVHSASCAVRAECTLGSVLCGFSPRNPRKPDHIAVFSQS